VKALSATVTGGRGDQRTRMSVRSEETRRHKTEAAPPPGTREGRERPEFGRESSLFLCFGERSKASRYVRARPGGGGYQTVKAQNWAGRAFRHTGRPMRRSKRNGPDRGSDTEALLEKLLVGCAPADEIARPKAGCWGRDALFQGLNGRKRACVVPGDPLGEFGRVPAFGGGEAGPCWPGAALRMIHCIP